MNEKELQAIAKRIAKQVKEPMDLGSEVAKLGRSNPTTNKATKDKVFKSLGSTLKTLAPVAAGFIPGVGPIASSLLSTLNDDEWFSQYTSAGASFNELLVTTFDGKAGNATTFITPRGAFAHVPIMGPELGVKDIIFPSMLAHVRQATNNVLADDVDSYYDVIYYSIQLYEVYYTMEKLIKFAGKLPLNIPMVTSLFTAIAPENLNVFIGMRDSLKSYLQSTIRLPYALVEAIRWRFGTMFHSFNTGQPGFINYHPHVGQQNYLALSGTMSPENFREVILNLQDKIIGAGRAAADIRLAYSNHQIRYDVEDAHYDEKEFNLRSNMGHTTVSSAATGIAIANANKHRLIKDSRLNSSPATQAILLSTAFEELAAGSATSSASAALFPPIRESISASSNYGITKTQRIFFSHYLRNTRPDLEYEDGFRDALQSWGYPHKRFNAGSTYSIQIVSGWHTFHVQTHRGDTLHVLGAPGAVQSVYFNLSADEPELPYVNSLHYAIPNSLGFYENNRVNTINVEAPTPNGTGNIVGRFIINSTPISYDLATIGTSTLVSIQTAALRNLTRGDYTRKLPDTETKPEMAKLASDIVEAIV